MTQTPTSDNHFPWIFFTLTFGFSWLIWLPAVLDGGGIVRLPVQGYARTLSLLGLFGPMFAACTLTFCSEGWVGIRRLTGRLFAVRFPAVWWCVVVVLPLSMQAVAHFLPRVTGERLPPSGTSSVWIFFSTFVFVLLLGGGQEEIGWRGYALDRIQSRFSALTSSLILGAIWAFWHLPLIYIPGTSLRFVPVGSFLLALLGLSVLLTWIYNNTGKSILAPMLTHGMANAAHAIFPIFVTAGGPQHVYTYWAIVCGVFAIAICSIWGPSTLMGRRGRPKSKFAVSPQPGAPPNGGPATPVGN